MCYISKNINRFIIIILILISSWINTYSQFSQIPVRLTYGNDRNPSFHTRNEGFDISNILWEFLAYERVNGSSVNIIVSKINTTGAVDNGAYLTNNSFININPTIGYYYPGYPGNEILNSVVVWKTNKNGNEDIYARIYKQNQGWLSEFPVDSSGGDQTNPKLVLINQNTYAIVYKYINDIKLKIINIDNQSILLDTNLTSGISENCKNPYIITSSGSPKKLFITFEREYSSSQNSIYCLKADTISNPLNLLIDTVRFSGYSYNAGFALMNSYLCLYESYVNGKRNAFGTEIKWNGQSSVHHNILTSQYFDMWSYQGSEFILGDNTTNSVFAFLTKTNNLIYAKVKMGSYFGDSVNALVSYDANYKSNISISSANGIPNTACFKFWFAFEKNRSTADSGIYGLSFTSCAMNIKKLQGIPTEYSLNQNYPNPFNPSTKIKFDIPRQGVVNLKIIDMLGREVAALVNESLQPGTYEVNWNASDFPSGVYFARLETGSYNHIIKMLLVK